MEDYKLPKKDLTVLRSAHRRERKKRYADRIKAVYLLGKGRTLVDVAEVLMLDEDTLRRYAKRYREGKIPLLLSDNYQAYEGKLTTKELTILDGHLQEVTYRRAIDIIAYIDEEFDVIYSVRGVTELLHRLGYTYKKPRKVPGKADKESQKEFVQKYRKIRKNMGKEDCLLFMDGVHPQHNPLVMNGWIKRGEEKQIRTNTR
jgi:transposase